MAKITANHHDARRAGRWWERTGFATLLVIACAVPLLWPALPPLSDLPGHMARWHIAMSLQGSAALSRYYAFHWAIIPNLGLDLIVPALTPLFGFEPATKIVVIAIPMLTAAGLLWATREAHGRIPPTAIFALPLVYAWPFQFGFVNFTLSQALAFCALGLWLRLARQRRFTLRAALFLPIGCVLWITHSFGWGLFGLIAGAAELARRRAGGQYWPAALGGTVFACLSLTPPLVFMILSTRGNPAGLGADDWFDLPVKAIWIISMLRDRWQWFDILSLVPIAAVLYLAARSPRLRYATVLGWPALACFAAFLLLPRLLMGGAYVDMRMAPAAAMLALVAIAPPAGDFRLARMLAVVGTIVFALRLAGTSASFVERAAEQQRELAAIPAIPRGAAVLALVSRPCPVTWSDLRRDQLPGMAVVRRDVFTNGQWTLQGQQLLRIRYTRATPYIADPSQQVLPQACATIGSNFETAIARFPRAAFTHVWTIGFPPGAAKAADLRLVWTNGGSALYRVVR